MDINRYLLSYFLFGFLGWVWESIYCTSNHKKWQNRGFLYGPICPIYGFGSICGLVAYDLMLMGKLPHMNWLTLFIVGFVVSMILEYPTSLILERLFHARWWDYSDVPLNINGRTSVPTSIGFGVASILVVNYLIPFSNNLINGLPYMVRILLPIILVALHSSDFTLTVSHLTNFQRHVIQIEDAFQEHMTETVDQFYKNKSVLYHLTISRVVSFNMSETKNEIAERLREEIKAYIRSKKS